MSMAFPVDDPAYPGLINSEHATEVRLAESSFPIQTSDQIDLARRQRAHFSALY
jgi:hypothetical protein